MICTTKGTPAAATQMCGAATTTTQILRFGKFGPHHHRKGVQEV